MKAVLLHRHGGPEVLEVSEVPLPEPGSDQVRLRVEAVALNHLDLWVRGGLPGSPIPLPHLLGSEIVGVIEELGPGAEIGLYGDQLEVGMRVLVAPMTSCRRCEWCLQDMDGLCEEGFQIFGYQRPGGYAEQIVIPADVCVALDPEDDPVAWAAVPLTFLTAWHMLNTRAGLRSGESVLVHAAGSGVGVAAIQIATQQVKSVPLGFGEQLTVDSDE